MSARLLASYTYPTPCSARPSSRTPPAKVPACTARIAWYTASSIPFTIDVSTNPGASAYWSASTPMASRPVARAASNTPSPVDPDAW